MPLQKGMMMDFTFTPMDGIEITVPFFEDALADFAPYYSVCRKGRHTNTAMAESEVMAEMVKLGAGAVLFYPGYFGDTPKRYGFEIKFQMGGAQGLIRVAGLPLKNETTKKVLAVRVQALLNVRDWLKAAVTSRVFSPGSMVLMQFLLVDGHRTLAEYVVEQRQLPQLDSPPAMLPG